MLSEAPLVCVLQVAFHYLAVYAVFYWLYFAASGIWVYEALSFENFSNLIYYIILPVLLTLSFYLM